jgi:hypothetical protein
MNVGGGICREGGKPSAAAGCRRVSARRPPPPTAPRHNMADQSSGMRSRLTWPRHKGTKVTLFFSLQEVCFHGGCWIFQRKTISIATFGVSKNTMKRSPVPPPQDGVVVLCEHHLRTRPACAFSPVPLLVALCSRGPALSQLALQILLPLACPLAPAPLPWHADESVAQHLQMPSLQQGGT